METLKWLVEHGFYGFVGSFTVFIWFLAHPQKLNKKSKNCKD